MAWALGGVSSRGGGCEQEGALALWRGLLPRLLLKSFGSMIWWAAEIRPRSSEVWPRSSPSQAEAEFARPALRCRYPVYMFVLRVMAPVSA